MDCVGTSFPDLYSDRWLMPPLFVARRIDAVEAYDRERENICPMEAVFDVPGIEPAPNIEIRRQ